jgi:hypothetical protein
MNNNLTTTPNLLAGNHLSVSRHTRWKNLVQQVLTAFGFHSRTELRHCDACGIRDQHVICFEVEDQAIQHVLVNLTRDFNQGANHVAIGCPDLTTQAAICRLLARELSIHRQAQVSVITCSLIEFAAQVAFSDPETISQHVAGEKQTKT